MITATGETEGPTMANPTHDLQLVLLDLHARAPAVNRDGAGPARNRDPGRDTSKPAGSPSTMVTSPGP